jgi:hypothetical protein
LRRRNRHPRSSYPRRTSPSITLTERNSSGLARYGKWLALAPIDLPVASPNATTF